MSDRRLRELERRASETGDLNDAVHWILEAYRSGRPSLAPCLSCDYRGCECEPCAPKDCTACGNTRVMGLDDAVVVGAVFGDPSCVMAAGWEPTVEYFANEGSWLDEVGAMKREKRRRPMHFHERMSTLTRIGATDARNRAELALMTSTRITMGETVAGEITRQSEVIWTRHALEPCRFKRGQIRSDHREHCARLASFEQQRVLRHGHWTSTHFHGLRYMIKGTDKDAFAAISRDLVPYLLGRHDPVREALERLPNPEVDSRSDQDAQESSTAAI